MVWPYHFCRSLAHDVMHGMVQGSRGRGWPKKNAANRYCRVDNFCIAACVRETEER